jgi:hypothetical protein
MPVASVSGLLPRTAAGLRSCDDCNCNHGLRSVLVRQAAQEAQEGARDPLPPAAQGVTLCATLYATCHAACRVVQYTPRCTPCVMLLWRPTSPSCATARLCVWPVASLRRRVEWLRRATTSARAWAQASRFTILPISTGPHQPQSDLPSPICDPLCDTAQPSGKAKLAVGRLGSPRASAQMTRAEGKIERALIGVRKPRHHRRATEGETSSANSAASDLHRCGLRDTKCWWSLPGRGCHREAHPKAATLSTQTVVKATRLCCASFQTVPRPAASEGARTVTIGPRVPPAWDCTIPDRCSRIATSMAPV